VNLEGFVDKIPRLVVFGEERGCLAIRESSKFLGFRRSIALKSFRSSDSEAQEKHPPWPMRCRLLG
jgi:hypothetical protein